MSDLESRLSQKLEGEQLRHAIARMRALPRYASDWERRAAALGPDHDAIDEAIKKLRSMRDPLKCPNEWLFLLAWDLSVDVWDSEWPTEIKRRVCQAAWVVHRYKGTQWAIEEALKAIGMSVDLRPWFKFDPPLQRGTFQATVYIDEPLYPDDPNPLNERQYNTAYEAIWRTKPLTRHFSMRLSHLQEGEAFVGVITGIHTDIILPAELPELLPQETVPGMAVATHVHTEVTTGP